MSGSVDPATLAVIQAEIANTYGDILLGTFFGLILFGVTLHQAYFYCRTSYQDSVMMRAYIGLVVLLDAFHAVICMHISYNSLVTHYLDPTSDFENAPWSINLLPLDTVIVVIACQGFLAYRVGRVGGKKFIPIVLFSVIMMLAQVGVAGTGTAFSFIEHNFEKFFQFSWTVSAAYGLAAGVDLVLSITLTLFLRRSRSAFASTNSMLDLLTAYTMSTGALTTTFGVIAFILSLADPHRLSFAAVNIVGTKIYTNTVLAAINLRSSRTMESSRTKDVSVELGALSTTGTVRRMTRPPVNDTQSRSSYGEAGIQIKVQKELIEDVQ